MAVDHVLGVLVDLRATTEEEVRLARPLGLHEAVGLLVDRLAIPPLVRTKAREKEEGWADQAGQIFGRATSNEDEKNLVEVVAQRLGELTRTIEPSQSGEKKEACASFFVPHWRPETCDW